MNICGYYLWITWPKENADKRKSIEKFNERSMKKNFAGKKSLGKLGNKKVYKPLVEDHTGRNNLTDD